MKTPTTTAKILIGLSALFAMLAIITWIQVEPLSKDGMAGIFVVLGIPAIMFGGAFVADVVKRHK